MQSPKWLHCVWDMYPEPRPSSRSEVWGQSGSSQTPFSPYLTRNQVATDRSAPGVLCCLEGGSGKGGGSLVCPWVPWLSAAERPQAEHMGFSGNCLGLAAVGFREPL